MTNEKQKEIETLCNEILHKVGELAGLVICRETQFEKMKCSGNCNTLEKGECIKAFSHTSEDCRNCDKWEMKE